MKAAGVASAGALGGLAGYSGSAMADSAASQAVSVSFLSANAVENSDIQDHFQSSMEDFAQKNSQYQVDLQTASYGDIQQALSSRVQNNNPPALAESGGLGLEFFRNDQLVDHASFMEESDSLPDDLTAAGQQVAEFRDEWWSIGAIRNTNSNLGIRPKTFSQVGVENPMEELQTWSQFYEVLQRIDQQQNIIAYEETGTPGDLESYWGYARTAYTGGTDPWIRGPGENPDVVINNEDMEEDRQKTDGMIKAGVTLANEFSSDEAAQRGDEEIPSLMMTGRVASFNYALATANRWYSVTPDAQIGWNNGNGDFMLLPHPRLDEEFGNAIGIDDLSGHSGEHGGHVWALEQCHTIFDAVNNQQQEGAWALSQYLLEDNDFVLPAWGEHYEALPGLEPKLEALTNEYDLPQNFQQSLENQQTYGDQYSNTGGPWDVWPTDPIRWTDINETISEAIAGQHSAEETPSLIRERVLTRLEQENN